MDHLILIALGSWLAAAIICYFLLRQISYNVLDPIVVTSVFIPFSASLLTVLCATDLVLWDKLLLFSTVLLAYLLGICGAAANFQRSDLRKKLNAAISEFSRAEIQVLLVVAIAVTLALAVLGLTAGAEGDARQHFGRIFRPLVVLQNGVFLTTLALLLSPRLSVSRSTIWLLVLAAISIPFSGKSVLVPVIFWIGLKLFLNARRVSARTLTISLGLVVAGIAVMGLIAYGKSGIKGILLLIGYRLWMSGDVYIYAYQLHGLTALRSYYHVSFLPYMLHPITSLVGIRAYDKPLGSELASVITGENLFTGPNPQLPVLLDFFFPGSLFVSAGLAFIIGFLVAGVRILGMALTSARVRFIRLGSLVAAIFCPAAGFVDTSQVLVTLIGIAAATCLGVLLDLVFARSTSRDVSQVPHGFL